MISSAKHDFAHTIGDLVEELIEILPILKPVNQVQQAALTDRYVEEHQPITKEQILQPRRWEDKKDSIPTLTGKFN